MNITFNLELNSSNSSKGVKTILIRCTQNRKHKRISTGITIPVSSWNKNKQLIKASHKLSAEYNKLLQTKLKSVINAYNKLIDSNPSTNLDELVTSLRQNNEVNFFEFAYRTKMAEIKASNKLGTYKRYEAVLNKFREFSGKNLSFSKVDYNLIRRYELHLQNKINNSRDTTSSNLSVLRTIINEAIRCSVYTKQNPFEQIQLKYTNNTKEKLTINELKRLFTTQLPIIPSLQIARDFFKACFLAEGTRAGDMMAMQKENIINGHLVFKQQKTGRQMNIPITVELQAIFDQYSTEAPFIFPFLNNTITINEIIINSKLTYVNKYLKEVAKYCGIFKKLSTHVARHSFTDLALQVTHENIYLVQQSLGHSSVRTTEIYSRNRLNMTKEPIVRGILDLINNNDKT
jgi:site-specific recombinase XerD